MTLGLEIFPKVDAGRFQLRLRAPDGTRIEKTERLTIAALRTIEQEVGRDNVETSIGYVGLIASSYPINTIFQWTGGPEEAILRVAMKEGAKVDIERLKERLRRELATQLPGVRLSFEPADIVSEVMSFGSPTPVEVSVNGPNLAENRAFAETMRERTGESAVAARSPVRPVARLPDREHRGGPRARGPQRRHRRRTWPARSSRPRHRAGSSCPNYWPDPKTGIGYQVQVEIPYQIMDSVDQIETVPIQRPASTASSCSATSRTVREGTMPGEYDRYNMKRSVSLTANIAGEDLGRVAGRVQRAIERAGAPPKGATVDDPRPDPAHGRDPPVASAIGLGMSIVVILLLLTANFQSVKLALVVVSTAPAVVAGVVVMLWLTGTTVNLQSFMGAIMAIGVAVANAILLVTFAERHRRERGAASDRAAAVGAMGRLRPILMTSCAMTAGMVPMALGWSEGGEQTAPLARAVIGGLVAATIATLTVLPTVFALVQGWAGRESASLDPDDPASPHYHEEERGRIPVGPTVGQRRAASPATSRSRPPGPSRRLTPAPNRVADLSQESTPCPARLSLSSMASRPPRSSWRSRAGCERSSEGQAGQAAPPVMRVEIVHPERHTVRRSVGEPGELQAFETTARPRQDRRLRQGLDRQHRRRGQEGPGARRALGPRDGRRTSSRSRRRSTQAVAKHKLARAAVKVAEANVAGAEAKLAEVRAGHHAGRGRPRSAGRPSTSASSNCSSERAQTGSLLDETRNKLRSSEATRDEVQAQVKTAEVAVIQSQAALDLARSDVGAAAAAIEVAKAGRPPRRGPARLRQDRGPLRRHRHPAERQHRRPDSARSRPAPAVHRRPVRHRDDQGRRARGIRRRGQSRATAPRSSSRR